MEKITRKNSYQKLKDENAKLNQDLYDIVMKKDPIKIARYMFLFEMENMIWSGGINGGSTEG